MNNRRTVTENHLVLLVFKYLIGQMISANYVDFFAGMHKHGLLHNRYKITNYKNSSRIILPNNLIRNLLKSDQRRTHFIYNLKKLN